MVKWLCTQFLGRSHSETHDNACKVALAKACHLCWWCVSKPSQSLPKCALDPGWVSLPCTYHLVIFFSHITTMDDRSHIEFIFNSFPQFYLSAPAGYWAANFRKCCWFLFFAGFTLMVALWTLAILSNMKLSMTDLTLVLAMRIKKGSAWPTLFYTHYVIPTSCNFICDETPKNC